jgi:hypothetical protein
MMVAVNSVALTLRAQRSTAAARVPAARPASGGAATPAADTGSEPVRRARKAEMESILGSLAPPPSGMRAMAARILQEAERKLLRLEAEARTAAASGDRKAALRIARDLAVIARQIADTAQDYAVAEAQPDPVSPALVKAAARIGAEARSGAGGTVDAGSLVGEAAAAAAEAAQAAQAASAAEEPDTARPEPAEADGETRRIRQAPDPRPASANPSPSGSGDPHGETILAKACRLFDEAMALLHAMEALIGGRSVRTGRIVRADPVRPAGTAPVSVPAVRQAGSVPLAVGPHGR